MALLLQEANALLLRRVNGRQARLHLMLWLFIHACSMSCTIVRPTLGQSYLFIGLMHTARTHTPLCIVWHARPCCDSVALAQHAGWHSQQEGKLYSDGCCH